MNLKAQRRMAAKILQCGENKVYIDPYLVDEVAVAITMRDIRGLINSGIIRRRYSKGISRSRAKVLHQQKVKGRRKGTGKRKGPLTSRTTPKRDWISRIRKIRAFLKNMRDKNYIDTSTYQKYYYLAKGGTWNNVGQLKRFMQEKGLIKHDKVQKSKKKRK